MRRGAQPYWRKTQRERLAAVHDRMAACAHAGPYTSRMVGDAYDIHEVVCRCGATVERWTVQGPEWVRTFRDPKLPAPTTPDRQPVSIARRQA